MPASTEENEISRASAPRRRISRRRFLLGAAAAPVLAGLYAWRIEPHWLELVRRDLPVANLPAALHGKTLVQLSDLHIGPQVDDDYLGETFLRVADLRPDIVVHTGDLITYHGPDVLDQARRLLEIFPLGALGTFAILGNHDYGRKWTNRSLADNVAGLLAEAGCTVLRNQVAEVGGLALVGLDDLWSGNFHVALPLSRLDAAQPAVVLCHNPDACDLPGWGRHRGWILAGHTHGGQCKPPFLPPPIQAVENRRYTAGEFELTGGRRLYINRGVGHLLPVRFNVRPEVTVFRLVASEPSA